MLNEERLNAHTVRSGARKGCVLSLLLFNTELGFPVKVVRQEKIKGTQMEKEDIKSTLCADNMITCHLKNLQEN